MPKLAADALGYFRARAGGAPVDEPKKLRYRLLSSACMMGSADDMPKEAGAALDVLADKIVTIMDELLKERERLWRLAREAGDIAVAPD
jgi:hypothetical protein